MVSLFFLIAVTALGLGFAYIGLRLLGPMRLSRRSRFLSWLALALVFLLAPAALLLSFSPSASLPVRALVWAGFFSLGFWNFLLFFLLGRDITALARRLSAPLLRRFRAPAAPADPERRALLARGLNAGFLGLSGCIAGYGLFEARRAPAAVEVDLPLPGLPRAFEGFRIVQLTDLHAGPTIGRGFVETAARTVARLRPDLVAVTGDLVDGPVDRLRSVLEPLSGLEAPSGVFFVTGNHEYYSGVEAWLEEVRRMGWTPLLNEHRVLSRGKDRLVVAGVPDVQGSRFLSSHAHDPAGALAGAPAGAPRLLLAHQPLSIHAAAEAGFDAMICGHTHGGQYLPWSWVSGLANPYVHGLHRHGPTLIYVCRGAGYWGPPLRLAARSEIAVLRLRRCDPARAGGGA